MSRKEPLSKNLMSREQGDVMLRALRFMDSMIQRDAMQKAAFLNDLATFWDRFDDRVLRLKVCIILQTEHLMHGTGLMTVCYTSRCAL